jgi:hypothetical protein
VLVRHHGDVRPWSVAASAVIHNGCTTGIESALLDSPVFAYRPIRDEEYDPPLPNFVSTEVSTKDDLVSNLSDIRTDGHHDLSSEQQRALKRYFHNLDSQAATTIADEIDAMRTTANGEFHEFTGGGIDSRERICKCIPFAPRIAKRYRVKRDSLSPNRQLDQKFPYLYRSEIHRRIEDFTSYIETSRINIEQIGGWQDAFWIYTRSE